MKEYENHINKLENLLEQLKLMRDNAKYSSELEDINKKISRTEEDIKLNKFYASRENDYKEYSYDGKVYNLNDEVISHRIHITTKANSLAKAKSNILYQIKNKLNYSVNSKLFIDEDDIVYTH